MTAQTRNLPANCALPANCGTWTVVAHMASDIAVTHHDWRDDSAALWLPWGVLADGRIIARCATAGDAGMVAHALAAQPNC